MPIAKISALGFSTGINLSSPSLLGNVALLLPLSFIATTTSRYLTQLRHRRALCDLVAFGFAAPIAVYAIIAVLTGLSELNDAQRQMAHLLGPAASRQISMVNSMSFGGGIAALALLLVGSLWLVLPSRKAR